MNNEEKLARKAALEEALVIAEGPDVAMAYHKHCDSGACCLYRAIVIGKIKDLIDDLEP